METDLSNTIQLDGSSFDKDLNLIDRRCKAKSIILFYSPSCGHCVRFKPAYGTVARMLKNKDVSVCSVDMSENQDLWKRINDPQMASRRPYLVRGVPKVVSYYNGKYFSTYAPGNSGRHEYRSVDDVLEYIDGIGTADVTYTQDE